MAFKNCTKHIRMLYRNKKSQAVETDIEMTNANSMQRY